jgi:hypothetical protein
MPTMNNVGVNTAITDSIARKRGAITSCIASSTARPGGVPRARCVSMFSIATVASSTRMPTASASPPSVMMLIVWPASRNPTTAVRTDSGIVTITIRADLALRRNRMTASDVRIAPSTPSKTSPWIARET